MKTLFLFLLALQAAPTQALLQLEDRQSQSPGLAAKAVLAAQLPGLSGLGGSGSVQVGRAPDACVTNIKV